MANITRHFQRKNSLGTSADSTWDIYQLSYSDEARKSQSSVTQCLSVSSKTRLILPRILFGSTLGNLFTFWTRAHTLFPLDVTGLMLCRFSTWTVTVSLLYFKMVWPNCVNSLRVGPCLLLYTAYWFGKPRTVRFGASVCWRNLMKKNCWYLHISVELRTVSFLTNLVT